MHWPPISGSESMMRQLAWRIPAQNAVASPTGPAPITVMSTVSELMWSRAASESGVPSSALSARSTEVDTQVNVGVSRFVYADASVVRRRWTRSRKRAGSSASNATTNSWSSSPNE